MNTLRKKLIHLAYNNPQIRADLLPLIRQAEEAEKPPPYSIKQYEKDFVKPLAKQLTELTKYRQDTVDLHDYYRKARGYEAAFTSIMKTLDEAIEKYDEGLQLTDIRFPLFELINEAGALRSALYMESKREEALSAPRLLHLENLFDVMSDTADNLFQLLATVKIKIEKVLPK